MAPCMTFYHFHLACSSKQISSIHPIYKHSWKSNGIETEQYERSVNKIIIIRLPVTTLLCCIFYRAQRRRLCDIIQISIAVNTDRAARPIDIDDRIQIRYTHEFVMKWYSGIGIFSFDCKYFWLRFWAVDSIYPFTFHSVYGSFGFGRKAPSKTFMWTILK